jgi:hypothetical protein
MSATIRRRAAKKPDPKPSNSDVVLLDLGRQFDAAFAAADAAWGETAGEEDGPKTRAAYRTNSGSHPGRTAREKPGDASAHRIEHQ